MKINIVTKDQICSEHKTSHNALFKCTVANSFGVIALSEQISIGIEFQICGATAEYHRDDVAAFDRATNQLVWAEDLSCRRDMYGCKSNDGFSNLCSR